MGQGAQPAIFGPTPHPPEFPDRVRLPLQFDPAGLRQDLARLTGETWIKHFVPGNYEGDWSVIPLRGDARAVHPVMLISPRPGVTDYADQPALARAPAIRAVLAALACPLESVRLMRLAAGSVIKPHCDHDLAFELGAARLHVPIVTHPDVIFRLNDAPVAMAAGETWYLRLSDVHSVENRSDIDRVHLVIDVRVNDWLAAQLRAGD